MAKVKMPTKRLRGKKRVNRLGVTVPYHLVWATELSLAGIGLIFPALVLGYYFFIVKSMTDQFLYRLKNLYDHCWQQ
jgi:hypothetical protein